jgi:hypothetical protein
VLPNSPFYWYMYRERRRGYWFLIGSDRSSSAIVSSTFGRRFFSPRLLHDVLPDRLIASESITSYTQHTKGFLSTHMWGVCCCCCYRDYTIGSPAVKGLVFRRFHWQALPLIPFCLVAVCVVCCVVRWSTSLYNNLVLPVLLSPCIYGCISLYK